MRFRRWHRIAMASASGLVALSGIGILVWIARAVSGPYGTFERQVRDSEFTRVVVEDWSNQSTDPNARRMYDTQEANELEQWRKAVLCGRPMTRSWTTIVSIPAIPLWQVRIMRRDRDDITIDVYDYGGDVGVVDPRDRHMRIPVDNPTLVDMVVTRCERQ